MALLRWLVAAAGLLLAASIVWAATRSDFLAAFGMIVAEPWGVVTLIDLYLGFIITAVVIAVVDRRWSAALWIVPLFFLGNVVAAAWLVVRLPDMMRIAAGEARRA